MQYLENVLEDWASSLAVCARTQLEEIRMVCLNDGVRAQTQMAFRQHQIVYG